MAKNLQKVNTQGGINAGSGYTHYVDITASDLSTSTGEEFLYLTLNGSLFAGSIRKAGILVVEQFEGGGITDATMAVGLGDGSTTDGGGTSSNGDALVEEVDIFKTDSNTGLEFINTGADLDDAYGKTVAASGNGAVLGIATNGTGAGLGSATKGRAIVSFDISNVSGGQ